MNLKASIEATQQNCSSLSLSINLIENEMGKEH